MICFSKIGGIGRFACCCFLFLQSTYLISQQTIADARSNQIGTVVTTSGTITSGSEFGQIRFMQDASAGISIYSGLLTSTHSGDSVEVTGFLSLYKGQFQISPVNSIHVIQSSRPLPKAKVIDLNDQTNLSFESMRVILPCVGISSCESFFDSGWYTIYDSKGNVSRLIMAESGMPIPSNSISAIGIWVNVNDEFQLWCQGTTDVSEGSCKIIPLATVSFAEEQTTLTWDVDPETNSWVEYGIDDYHQIKIPSIEALQTSVSFDHLITGLIYKGRLGQISLSLDTIYSMPTYFSAVSTPSFPLAIFFDRSVDASYSDGSHPEGVGSSVIETDVIARIDQVTSTLDIAMYNTTRKTIVQAIERAVQRGVEVRYIADEETSNSALQGILPFPVLFRQGDGIMHNKFIIADADDPDLAWLWTGSTNFTANQMSSDPNHACVIRDQALALNYRREFDEFWGSLPNHSDGKEGEGKTDNTAHQFRVGDENIESYFSPSDETNCHILDALRSADHQILIGLLLLTKEDLVDEIIAVHENGVDTRVIVEDEESSSLALSRLRQAGVRVAVHDLSPLFHHKYAIIDEGRLDSDPLVITGSHNWTFSADNINDENTLIIHDQSVTNIFRQEYEARWSELVSTGSILISTNPALTLYPNPASDQIEMTNPSVQKCTITLIDINGNIIWKQKLAPHQTINFPIDQTIPNGMYLVHWSWLDNHAVSRVVMQR